MFCLAFLQSCHSIPFSVGFLSLVSMVAIYWLSPLRSPRIFVSLVALNLDLFWSICHFIPFSVGFLFLVSMVDIYRLSPLRSPGTFVPLVAMIESINLMKLRNQLVENFYAMKLSPFFNLVTMEIT